MTDIDLTAMNEATARELFAHVTTENALKLMDLTSEEKPVVRRQWQENMRHHWDELPATDHKRLSYRELALAATLTTWKSVARQAWANCAHAATASGDAAAPYIAKRLRDANPYEETPSA